MAVPAYGATYCSGAGELAPETNLLELIELIRGCQLFVGGDTGPMHMAAAMQVPTVAIFGASDPARNGPYGEGHLVLYHDIDCRPVLILSSCALCPGRRLSNDIIDQGWDPL